ncbi:MAG: hypothetical protein HY329_25490, partial [Chloroflexi bacterium]|nr:hypothetical protein [Chloroflexota bacterium]
DGFVGNVVLKLSEGIADVMFGLLREELSQTLWTKAAAAVLRPAFRRLKRRTNYEEHGGSPLLGVNGNVFVAHGRSRTWAVANAIRVAHSAAQRRLADTIRASMLSAPSRDVAGESEQGGNASRPTDGTVNGRRVGEAETVESEMRRDRE